MASKGKYFGQILCIFVIYVSITSSDGHSCSHRIPKPSEVVHGVPLDSDTPAHVIRKRSSEHALRIHLVYEGSVSQLPTQEQNLVKNNLIPSAVSYWEKTLKVRQTTQPIRLLRQCESNRVKYQDGDGFPYCVDGCKQTTMCGETAVPVEHLAGCREAPSGGGFRITGRDGEGVSNTDFILYVSAFETERCGVGTTVAYAAYCQLEALLDRPVAGYFNLCPSSISSLPHDMHQMQSTIKHEILHALGFSAGLFAFFRDPDGNPLTERALSDGKPTIFNEQLQVYQWSNQIIREIIRSDWEGINGKTEKIVQMIVTPNVLREVRAHFNCSSLEGAELEDQGVIGTALTHWEKRVFENEAMTGTYTQNPLISRITLALMEDTGWYSVDYSQAENLQWGRNLGCDFVKKSCYHWMNRDSGSSSPHPFCVRPKMGSHLETECPSNREAVVICNLAEYNQPLPLRYQQFSSINGVPSNKVSHYAGAVLLADYCPYLQELNWKKDEEVVRGSRCNLAQNNADPEINYNLEDYGLDSVCLDHSAPWTITQCRNKHDVEHWGSGCYQKLSQTFWLPTTCMCIDCVEISVWRMVACRGFEIQASPYIHHSRPLNSMHVIGSQKGKFSCSDGVVVHVGGQSLRCYHEGQVLRVQATTKDWLHQGTIICPSCQNVCQRRGIPCPPDRQAPAPQTLDVQAPCNHATVTIATTSTSLLSMASCILLILHS